MKAPIALGLLLLLAACGNKPSSAGPAGQRTSERPPPQPAAAAETHAAMRNVQFYLDPKLVLSIHALRGKLLPTRKDEPPTFDDKHSFALAIDSAEIGMSTASLSHLLTQYVFAYPGAPIKDLTITTEKGQLKQKGTVHKGVDLPFEMIGTLEATPEGMLRLHPTKLKTAHIPVKGIMNLFGLGVDDLIDAKGARGVRVEHNDLIMDPQAMLPPPHMRGHLSSVEVLRDGILLQFGGKVPAADPRERGPRNYMLFRGGVIRFGKLTMRDADLRLIDADPRNPFAFSLDRYKDHLVAGYSKTTPSFGLDVFMPDLDKLPRPTTTRQTEPRPEGADRSARSTLRSK